MVGPPYYTGLSLSLSIERAIALLCSDLRVFAVHSRARARQSATRIATGWSQVTVADRRLVDRLVVLGIFAFFNGLIVFWLFCLYFKANRSFLLLCCKFEGKLRMRKILTVIYGQREAANKLHYCHALNENRPFFSSFLYVRVQRV